MPPRSRRTGSILAVLACLLTPAGALAQGPPVDRFEDLPRVSEEFPGGGPAQTPTATPDATATATATAEPTATATAEPTATAGPAPGRDQLADTGSEPLTLALGGLSLLGLGLALRMRVALDDARHAQRG